MMGIHPSRSTSSKTRSSGLLPGGWVYRFILIIFYLVLNIVYNENFVLNPQTAGIEIYLPVEHSVFFLKQLSSALKCLFSQNCGIFVLLSLDHTDWSFAKISWGVVYGTNCVVPSWFSAGHPSTVHRSNAIAVRKRVRYNNSSLFPWGVTPAYRTNPSEIMQQQICASKILMVVDWRVSFYF